jgi:nicotinate-nucleotide pyrophosphorylase (carboxylating)
MLLNKKIKNIIALALKEDIGKRDITTLFTVAPYTKIEATIIAKEEGVLCGIELAKEVFSYKFSYNRAKENEKVIFKCLKRDGETFQKNEKIAIIKGVARLILTRERVALNFLSLLSGIATLTRKFTEKVRGTSAKIMDTRKTTPALRELEKYAVKIGGGYNHRMNLNETILIKDNHLRAERIVYYSKSHIHKKKTSFHWRKLDEEKIRKLISKLRALSSTKIEIEVENLKEFKGVIKYKPDIVMLDNFSLPQLKKAVIFRNKHYPQIKLEASGGINLANVGATASTGVDFISVGSITHSPKAIDFSLEIL